MLTISARDPAPFHHEIDEGPEQAYALWRRASDGVRVRVGIWPAAGSAQGTVLLFPGRTEFIEKYGHVAADCAARGLSVIAIDWRGQGIADRLMDDPYRGHVDDFADYQKDVQQLVTTAREEGLPEPYFLLGHSMGGAIGLRALHNGLPVARAAFSAPMWGIQMAPVLRPTAWALTRLAAIAKVGGTLTPGTQARSFILNDPFQDNTLTRDPQMWQRMGDQIRAVPEFELGGPSMDWLRLAVQECTDLMRRPAPNTPCVTVLGTHERIVSTPEIHDMMNRWNNGALDLVDGAEHEVLMDLPDTRAQVMTRILDFYLG